MEDTRLLSDTVRELVRDGALGDLRRALEEQPVEVLVDLIEHETNPIREAVFSALAPGLAGEVAAQLDETVREGLLEDVPSAQLAAMVADLDTDEAIEILEDATPELAGEVLSRLDPEDAGELRELLGYEDDSAGRVMAFGAPAVRQETTLGQAITLLRRNSEELDEVETVFVVDAVGRLRGYLPLQALLFSPPDVPVTEAMRRDMVFAYTYEDQETVAARAQRSRQIAVPVIDARGVLRGQITQDRLREILEEEASEDMYRMVGLPEDESVFSSFSFSLKKRLFWLQINLVTAILAAWVISFFEATIAQVAVLAALQSIVAGQGGNATIQTLTIIIRGLALGELDWRNSKRVFFKELTLGFANGASVGLVIALLVWLWKGNFWLGVIIFAAMMLNMVAAAIGGFLIPMVLRLCKQDPAQAAGVFATTITDVCGFFFFLGLATLMLPLIHGVK